MEQLLLTGRMDFADFFFRLFCGGREWHTVLFSALEMIGLWKMFEKSGVKGWWALIPAAREYQMSRCAGREPEGRVLSVLTALTTLYSVFGIAP